MMEWDQFDPWLMAAGGYIAHPLAGYEKSAAWTVDPNNTPYRDSVKNMRPAGYARRLGYASAGAGSDVVVTNMVAEAAERARKRAERHCKV